VFAALHSTGRGADLDAVAGAEFTPGRVVPTGISSSSKIKKHVQ
jgi:hypothetical protein